MKLNFFLLGLSLLGMALGGSAQAQTFGYYIRGYPGGDLTYGPESGPVMVPGSAYWSRGDLTYGARDWAAPGLGDQTYRPLGCSLYRGRTYCR